MPRMASEDGGGAERGPAAADTGDFEQRASIRPLTWWPSEGYHWLTLCMRTVHRCLPLTPAGARVGGLLGAVEADYPYLRRAGG